MLQNRSKLCSEVVSCKPLLGLDEGEQRLARCWLSLKEIVFHGHH